MAGFIWLSCQSSYSISFFLYSIVREKLILTIIIILSFLLIFAALTKTIITMQVLRIYTNYGRRDKTTMVYYIFY